MNGARRQNDFLYFLTSLFKHARAFHSVTICIFPNEELCCQVLLTVNMHFLQYIIIG